MPSVCRLRNSVLYVTGGQFRCSLVKEMKKWRQELTLVSSRLDRIQMTEESLVETKPWYNGTIRALGSEGSPSAQV
ncbi:hypothetical protein E2C01_000427 [Portunus trituberculatus]|uniref:Uncharacterized protein n=1 Tax=Portunus trituberculatus TaxID=210409 RepID=A0A5B7CF60_PORTR|nr:hypothetical protein [Portunus trituberculatus]